MYNICQTFESFIHFSNVRLPYNPTKLRVNRVLSFDHLVLGFKFPKKYHILEKYNMPFSELMIANTNMTDLKFILFIIDSLV